MKNLKNEIVTLIGVATRIEKNHYKVGFFHLEYMYSNFAPKGYNIHIWNELTNFSKYITVKTRRGLYAAITYFYYLTDESQIKYLNDNFGGYQKYFDTVCETVEYITEQHERRCKK
ncbi:MAG: hypothetical protein J6S85_12805 [Methanobrevibacter sp.]|nr:hypothetical protein [Methanobrevibacter sp.]